MDLLTQGLTGAVLAQCAAPGSHTRKAGLIGFLSGMLPDADALLRSEADPLLFLEFHRHFTHALVLVPAGALVAALVLWWPFRTLGFMRIYLYAFLGYALAGILDACTSYGTHLWWPFSDERTAWSLVSIVDPLFTVVLLAGVLLAFGRRSRIVARGAIIIACCYLGLAFVQQQRAYDLAQSLTQTRQHQPERLLVKPTFGNIVLWRSVYVHGGRVYADGVRPGLLGADQVFPGENLPLLTDGQIKTWAGPVAGAAGVVPRFDRFSDGLMVIHPARPDIIGDARFALLPTSLEPLWGITPREVTGPDAVPVDYVTNRDMTPQSRAYFKAMLLGE